MGWSLRLAGAGLLTLLGMVTGAWFATIHFRPDLDKAQDQVAACAAARDNLVGLAQEQGKVLGEITLAANARQLRAEQAEKDAQASAWADYSAANRLQQERIGGDQCMAVVSIIDKELGL